MHKAAGIQKTLDATDDSQQHSQQQRLNRCYQPGGIGWRLFWSKVPLRSSNHKWYLSAMHNSVKSINHWVTAPCTIMSLPLMEHRCAHRKVELHGPYGVFFSGDSIKHHKYMPSMSQTCPSSRECLMLIVADVQATADTLLSAYAYNPVESTPVGALAN